MAASPQVNALGMTMAPIRCASCSRLLAEGQYERLKIRCQRCGAWNLFTAERAPRSDTQHATARPVQKDARRAEQIDS